MKWLKQNWFKLSIIIMILIIIGGIFRWFQWRPVEIRKECQKNIENADYRDTLERRIQLKLGGSENVDLYQNCLREHGLEK